MSQPTSLLRNVLANYLGPLLNGVVNLVLVTLLVGHLGPVNYGVLVLAMTLLAAVALLDLGLGTAATKYVAEFGGREDWRALARITASYLGLATSLGFAFALPFLFVSRPIAVFLKVPADILGPAEAVLRLTGLTILFLFPEVALSYLMQGRQRYDLTNALSVAVSLARGLLLGATVLLGGGLVALAVVVALIQLAALVGAVKLCRRAMPEVPLRLGWPEREVLRWLLGFGWATFLADAATVWIRNLDALLVSRLISVAAVTPYTVAGKVPLALTFWVWAGPRVTLPWFAELEARDEREKMRHTFLVGLRLLLLVLVPVGSLLVALAGPVLAVWVGSAFVPHAILLQIFAVVFVADAMRGLAVMALYGAGRPQSVFWMCAVQFSASLALIFLWAPRAQLLGVALAVAVPALLIDWGVLLPYACRILQIPARDFLNQALRSHLLPAVLFWAALAAAYGRVPAELGLIAAAFLVGGALYLLLYWLLGVNSSERASVLEFARARLRAVAAVGSPRSST